MTIFLFILLIKNVLFKALNYQNKGQNHTHSQYRVSNGIWFVLSNYPGETPTTNKTELFNKPTVGE